jgi:hypothetical protein
MKIHAESSLEKLSSGERRRQFKLNKMRAPQCASDQQLAAVVLEIPTSQLCHRKIMVVFTLFYCK